MITKCILLQITLLVITVAFSAFASAQSCSPGGATLGTQLEVDNFQLNHGPCDQLGSLWVEGADITNLDGLSALTSIEGSLSLNGNTALENLDGLSALTRVGTDNWDTRLYIVDNTILTNLDGLAALTTLHGYLTIGGNDNLMNINGLSGINSSDRLYITYNAVLTNLNGLSGVTSVGDWLVVQHNPMLSNLDGLSGVTSAGSIIIGNNTTLKNLNGLSALTGLDGELAIYWNASLGNLDGLSMLASVGNDLDINSNASLKTVDGLSALTSIEGSLGLHENTALENLDGLSALTGVGNLYIDGNQSLISCDGLSRLLDQWDDAEPGPGPGFDGVPDVGEYISIHDNLAGCNSVQEILADVDPSRINAGLNDAWFYEPTSGQGFFITVFPDLGYVSLAWFTYDTELPLPDAVANLGDPGHRWITAVGPIEGNQVTMNIEMTSGGLFDTATLIDRTDPPGSDGTIILTFDSCNSGTVEYDILSINRQGTVPIQRVAGDNIVLCEALNSN